jgi:hypothetical protein
MYERFYELQLCEGHWKVNQIAITSYPGWYRTHGIKNPDVKEEQDLKKPLPIKSEGPDIADVSKKQVASSITSRRPLKIPRAEVKAPEVKIIEPAARTPPAAAPVTPMVSTSALSPPASPILQEVTILSSSATNLALAPDPNSELPSSAVLIPEPFLALPAPTTHKLNPASSASGLSTAMPLPAGQLAVTPIAPVSSLTIQDPLYIFHP